MPYCMSFTNPLCWRFLWVVSSGGSEGFMEPADCCQPSRTMRPAPCWNVLDTAQNARRQLEADSTNASWKLTKSHKEHRSQFGRAVDIAHVAATKRPASSVPVLASSFKTWRLWPVLQVWDDFDWMAARSQGCGTPVPFGKLTYEDLNWSFWTCFSVENIQTLKRDNLSKDAVMIQIDLLQFQSMRFADMHCCQGTRGQLCSRPAQTQKVFDRRGYPWLAHGQIVQTE